MQHIRELFTKDSQSELISSWNTIPRGNMIKVTEDLTVRTILRNSEVFLKKIEFGFVPGPKVTRILLSRIRIRFLNLLSRNKEILNSVLQLPEIGIFVKLLTAKISFTLRFRIVEILIANGFKLQDYIHCFEFVQDYPLESNVLLLEPIVYSLKMNSLQLHLIYFGFLDYVIEQLGNLLVKRDDKFYSKIVEMMLDVLELEVNHAKTITAKKKVNLLKILDFCVDAIPFFIGSSKLRIHELTFSSELRALLS